MVLFVKGQALVFWVIRNLREITVGLDQHQGLGTASLTNLPAESCHFPVVLKFWTRDNWACASAAHTSPPLHPPIACSFPLTPPPPRLPWACYVRARLTPGDPGSGSGAWPLPGRGAGAGGGGRWGSRQTILSGGGTRTRPESRGPGCWTSLPRLSRPRDPSSASPPRGAAR